MIEYILRLILNSRPYPQVMLFVGIAFICISDYLKEKREDFF
jgi:hypothetical protein